MRTLLALMAYTVALFAERFFGMKEAVPPIELENPGELTDEIRRYDTEDLILQ